MQALLNMENEKIERDKRKRNLVLSGFPKQTDCSDEGALLKLCEENFDIKPHFLQIRRIGRQENAHPRKLKITVENESVAADLLSASCVLRDSANPVLSHIFFNRDLTPMEGQLAYEARQQRRNKFSSTKLKTGEPST